MQSDRWAEERGGSFYCKHEYKGDEGLGSRDCHTTRKGLEGGRGKGKGDLRSWLGQDITPVIPGGREELVGYSEPRRDRSCTNY
jgi:hypothetical protein